MHLIPPTILLTTTNYESNENSPQNLHKNKYNTNTCKTIKNSYYRKRYEINLSKDIFDQTGYQLVLKCRPRMLKNVRENVNKNLNKRKLKNIYTF